MEAQKAGCIIGFSDDVQSHIAEPCAVCKSNATDVRWFPWPGLWLCPACFMKTDSEAFKRLEVTADEES